MQNITSYYKFLVTLGFLFIILSSIAQNFDDKKYDIFTDTLIIINGKTIDTERILMKREDMVSADTFQVNQKGLKIVSFKMSALALGNSIELSNDKPILSQPMRNEIINKQVNYKFIYIKDINLQTNDGRLVNPSLNSIKIIFSN